MTLFLHKNAPLISKELLNPWRVASLGIGLVMLVLGSVYLPSDDWDVPLCFVMGLPAYVLAPWVVRQAVGLRWKWLLLATFAFWLTVDGTYTLYWWLKGFPHLAEFRPANFFYCTPIFWIAGCFWNVDFKSMEWRLPKAAEMESFQLGVLQIRIVLVVLVIAGMIEVAGSAARFQPLGNKSSSECDPVELCPEMDEVIGNCHKVGWGVCEDDLDEVDSNEGHGVELGPGDEIVIKEKRLNGISSLRDSLDARHGWWMSKYGKDGDGEVDCIGLRIAGSSVGLVASALDTCLDVHRQKVFVLDMIGVEGFSAVSADTQLELPKISHGFVIDLSAKYSNWHSVIIDRGGHVVVDGVSVSDEGELQSMFAELRRTRRKQEPQMFIRADCRLSFVHVFRVLRSATAAGIWRHYLVGCADEKTGRAKVVPINLPCP